jgi:hypothetical protein
VVRRRAARGPVVDAGADRDRGTGHPRRLRRRGLVDRGRAARRPGSGYLAEPDPPGHHPGAHPGTHAATVAIGGADAVADSTRTVAHATTVPDAQPGDTLPDRRAVAER